MPLMFLLSINIEKNGSNIYICTLLNYGPGYLSRHKDSLWAGQSGQRILVGGWDFPHPFRPALGPSQAPIQWVPGLSRDTAAKKWQWPPTPKFKERV